MKLFYNSLKALSLLSILAISSCSSDKDNNDFTCPTVESAGQVTINQNSVIHNFNNFKYSYIERESKNDDGSYTFEMVYATYDINSAKFDDIEKGARLIIKFTSPTALPSGAYSLNGTTNKITSANFVYRDETVAYANLTIDEMSINFSGMTDCYAHTSTMTLKDSSATPAVTIQGGFSGAAVNSTIYPPGL